MIKKGIAVAGLTIIGAGLGYRVGEFNAETLVNGRPEILAKIAACAGQLGVGEVEFPVSELTTECQPFIGAFDHKTITITHGGSRSPVDTQEYYGVTSPAAFQERAVGSLSNRDSWQLLPHIYAGIGGGYGLASGMFISRALSISSKRRERLRKG